MRQGFQTIGNKVRAFGTDRQGNFAVLTAVIASAMALGVGFGVNVTQLYNIKSGLRNALDAAVTSTARDLTTGKIDPKDARARFEAFFFANSDPEFAASDRLVLDKLIVDQTAKTVTATAYVDADLLFPLFSGGATRRVGQKSAALYSDKVIEVAMMLDITGSMSGQKIKDLKTAATNAVECLPRRPGSEEAARARRDHALCGTRSTPGNCRNIVFVETQVHRRPSRRRTTDTDPPRLPGRT